MLRAFPSWDASKHHLWHVIRYMKQCFFHRDTWSECNEQMFMAQAHACAIESLKNIHDPADGKISISESIVCDVMMFVSIYRRGR